MRALEQGPMLQTLEPQTPATEAVGREIALSAISSPMLCEGLRYWNAKRGVRAFPSRAEIQPAEMKKILPHIILAKTIDDGRDFEFRLAGQSVMSAHGFNPTGWKVSELDRHAAGFTAVVMRVYGRVQASGVPYASRGTLKHLDRSFRSFESLFLPLGPDGRAVDHIFVVAGFSGEVDGAKPG
jgi:hypothetical protein